MYKYRYEQNGGETNCYPVDTDEEIWIASEGKTLSDLIAAAKEKWPDVNVEDINIESVNHHQYCIYYDMHDSSDYVQYFVLSVDLIVEDA